jgi:hypothetical protein
MLYKVRIYLLGGILVLLVLFKVKGCIPLFNSGPAPALLYSHPFPPNHQLTPEDVDLHLLDTNRRSVHDSLNAFIGRHLLTPQNAGAVIRSADLSGYPRVQTPGKDSVVLVLPLDTPEKPWLQLIDAGAFIELADTPHTFKADCRVLRVLAVHWSTLSVPGNWMLLEEPASDVTENQFRMASSTTRKILLLNNGTRNTGPCRVIVRPDCVPGRNRILQKS